MHKRHKLRGIGILGVLCTLSVACQQEVEGPAPTIQGKQSGAWPVAPGIVCRDQVETKVELFGSGFSPIPIDIPNGPKVALPSVTLERLRELAGDESDDQVDVLFSGSPDDTTNLKWLTWQSQNAMTLTINQKLDVPGGENRLPVGIYDILVRNPNDEQAHENGMLAVVEKPVMQVPQPSITCLAQGARDVTLRGTMFLDIEGVLPELNVADVDAPFAASALSDCEEVDSDGVEARFCSTAAYTLGEDSVEPGYVALTLNNPDPAPCHSEEEISLRVVPPPVITRVVPPLACVEQSARQIVIEGDWFLQIDGALPALTVGGLALDVTAADGCELLETMDHEVSRCTQLTFAIPEDLIPAGQPEIVVTNPQPAGCSASNAVALTLVPAPTVSDVAPSVLCLSESERQFEVSGQDFLTVDGLVPSVLVGAIALEAEAIVADECEPLAVDGMDVSRCDKLVITLARGGVDPGVQDVTVTNPDPAGCTDTLERALAIVDAPSVASVEPVLVCTDDGSRQVDVAGVGFLKLGDVIPTVRIDGDEVAVDAVSGCEATDVGAEQIELCTTISVTIAQGALTAGKKAVEVENPEPAGCSATADVLTVPPSLSIAAASPSNICTAAGAQSVEFAGTGFLQVDGAPFEVFVDGLPVSPTAVSGCEALDVEGGVAAEACTQFTLTMDPTGQPAGDVEVAVANPAPSSCEVAVSSVFRFVDPPTLTNVAPGEVCSDVVTTLTLTGTGFVEGTAVSVGTVSADTVTVNTSTELTATFDSGLPAGTFDITISNDAQNLCATTATGAIIVDPTPLVFFVDPPVVYNGIQVGATIFASGLPQDAASVELVDVTGTAIPVLSFDSPDRPERIQAEIQSGLTAGAYEVRVTSQLGCVGGLPGALQVSSTLTLDVASIDPSYVSTSGDTAVTLQTNSPLGNGLVGFESTPRVYLDPADDDSLAMALRAVEFNSASQLTAVVPAGLTPGAYNLIVVNPSGDVGVLSNGLTITAAEPPRITAVVPASLDNNADQSARIVGENFDTNGVTVAIECKAPLATTTTVLAGVVTNVTSTEVTATLPSSGLAADTVCIVQVTNGDGATYRHSAISAKAPSQNLGDWSNGPALTVGRRALSAVAARPTEASRFVYAIGGDDGDPSSAMDSFEAASVDVFGGMGAFSTLRGTLTSPCTLAGAATVGSFVYLTGGHDGTSAQAVVQRAQVLNPLDGPEVVDLDASLLESGGLGAGQWFYRVSALFPSTDPSNPSGESLPGEPFTVQLPVSDKHIALKVEWAQVSGASGYRLYRSSAADGAVSDLELLSEVDCPTDAPCGCGVDIACEFSDSGVATNPVTTPLPPGSLGRWHELANSMTSAREGHKTIAVANPSTLGETFLYAFGGRDENGAFLDTYEWATITTDSIGAQTVSTWTEGTKTIGTAKADLGVWVVSNDDSSQVAAGRTQIFVGTGYTSANTTTGEVLSGLLDGSSVSGELTTVGANSLDAENGAQQVAAAAFGDSGGYLFVFTGTRNSLTTSDSSTQVVAGPDLDNWNSLGGGSVVQRRAYGASVQESAFFFILGGTDGSNAITSVERTVQ